MPSSSPACVIFYNNKDICDYDNGASDDMIAHWYGRAVALLQERGLTSMLTEDAKELPKLIEESYRTHSVVVVVMHGVAVDVDGDLPPNVYIYGPEPQDKLAHFELLTKAGVPVPDWVFQPKSWDDVFARLGDAVVIKPKEGIGIGHGVKLVTPETSHDYAIDDDVIYSKYVGPAKSPYWKVRADCLFGRPISFYRKEEDQPIITGPQILPGHVVQGKLLTHAEVDPAVLDLCAKASRAIFDAYGCTLVGIDVAGSDAGNYVLEVNTQCIGLAAPRHVDVGPVHERIAEACVGRVRELLANA